MICRASKKVIIVKKNYQNKRNNSIRIAEKFNLLKKIMDDSDEKATRLYFVVGHLEQYFPEITARFSCGGIYQEIDPTLVLESMGEEFPDEWLDNVTKCPRNLDRALLAMALPEVLL